MKKAFLMSLVLMPLAVFAQDVVPVAPSFWDQLKSAGLMIAIYAALASIASIVFSTMATKTGIIGTIGGILKSIVDVFSANLKH